MINEHMHDVSTPVTRRGQIATPEAVAAVCDQLFRQGEAITEIAVRQLLGGGSTPVIYRHIRLWEEAHRRQFLTLEAQAQAVAAGQTPPDVPDELWRALKPAWERVVAQATAAAETGVADARQALAAERAALEDETSRVRELDARWQTERVEWSEKIADQNTRLAEAQANLQAQEGEIRRLTRREADLLADSLLLKRRAYELQAQMDTALAEAQTRHETDQERWLQQIDAARQEAKSTAQQAERRESDLQRRLDTASTELSDKRIELERVRIEANGHRAQLEALQTEHTRVRDALARKEQQIEQLLAEEAERRDRESAGSGKRSARKSPSAKGRG